MTQATLLDIRPLAGALGAEVFGLDLSQPLSDVDFQQVEAALHDHLVIFFRDQTLTPEQHKAFSQRFGGLLEVPFVRALPGHPEILPVAKSKTEKTRRNFGGLWHSDMSYSTEPPLGSALYARVIPPYGGDTMWTNMYAAFDGLSDKLKEVLLGLRAIHSPVRS